MSFFVLLEAETGKVYVKPFLDLYSVKDCIGVNQSATVAAQLLPEPFRIYYDSSALRHGAPINLMGSFYYGMIQNRNVVAGNAAIIKSVFSPASETSFLTGLSIDELRFILYNLSCHFGVHVPEIAS